MVAFSQCSSQCVQEREANKHFAALTNCMATSEAKSLLCCKRYFRRATSSRVSKVLRSFLSPSCIHGSWMPAGCGRCQIESRTVTREKPSPPPTPQASRHFGIRTWRVLGGLPWVAPNYGSQEYLLIQSATEVSGNS